VKLHAEAREAVEAALVAAHEGGGTTRGIAGRFVRSIRDLERFGQPWVADYLEDLTIRGAMKVCADWRRKTTVKARTKSGVVDLPGFVGRTNDHGEATQEPLIRLDLDAVLDHKRRLSAQRNTLSRSIAALDQLIALMEANPALRTVGEALPVLMAVAS